MINTNRTHHATLRMRTTVGRSIFSILIGQLSIKREYFLFNDDILEAIISEWKLIQKA